MMIARVIFLIWISILTCLSSWFFELSFAISFAFVTVLIFLGHLITLDEDFKGSWSNPEGKSIILKQSIIELIIKLLFSVLVWWLVLSFPILHKYGI